MIRVLSLDAVLLAAALACTGTTALAGSMLFLGAPKNTATNPAPTAFSATAGALDLAIDRAANLSAANAGNVTIERYAPAGVGSVSAMNLGGFYLVPPFAVPEPSSLMLGCLTLVSLDLSARARDHLPHRAA